MEKSRLAELLNQARCGPHEFFASWPLKELQRESHPDRWPNDTVWATETFSEFGRLFDIASEPQVLIESPTRSYRVIGIAGDGNLRSVLRAKYRKDDLAIIKVPKLKSRAANNLIAKEREICESLLDVSAGSIYRHYFPVPIESFMQDKARINAFVDTGGLFSAVDILSKHGNGLDGRHIAWMFKRLLIGVGFAHRYGWCHGAITPEHVLFCPEKHGAMITGWIHGEKVGNKIKTIPLARKGWYPRQCAKDKKLTPAVDIHMAATLMEWLSDKSVPRRMAAFLQGCKLGDASDAWALHDEFDGLLRQIYGKPKFVELPMF